MDLEKFLQNMRMNESSEQSEIAERLIYDALEGADKDLVSVVALHLKSILKDVSLCSMWLDSNDQVLHNCFLISSFMKSSPLLTLLCHTPPKRYNSSDSIIFDIVSAFYVILRVYETNFLTRNQQLIRCWTICKQTWVFSWELVSRTCSWGVQYTYDWVKSMLPLKQTLLLSCRILQYLWIHIAQILKEKYEEITSFSINTAKKRHLYQTLWTMTDATRNFFQAGGAGLTGEQLNTDDFRVRFCSIHYSALFTITCYISIPFTEVTLRVRDWSLALGIDNKVQLSSWQEIFMTLTITNGCI